METQPSSRASAESYEGIFEVRLAGLGKQELVQKGVYPFSVTPEFTIFLTKGSHLYLSAKYGANLDETLAEGYLTIRDNGTQEIEFKSRYQPNPGFKGSSQELASLQSGVKAKLLSFLNS